MSECFPGQNLIKKQIYDSVADIFYDIEPNIVTSTVNKAIQCGLFEGLVHLRTNRVMIFIWIWDGSPFRMIM